MAYICRCLNLGDLIIKNNKEWKDMGNSSFSARLTTQTIEKPNINVAYPQVIGLYPPNMEVRYKGVPEKINESIEKLINAMMLEMGANNPNLAEMIGTYKVTLNQDGILSIRFENFSYIEMYAHP